MDMNSFANDHPWPFVVLVFVVLAFAKGVLQQLVAGSTKKKAEAIAGEDEEE